MSTTTDIQLGEIVNLNCGVFGSESLVTTASRVSSLRINVKAGSKLDPEGREGLSHLLEHMLLCSSEKYDSPRKLAELVTSTGGSYEVYTDREYLTFEAKIPNEDLDNGLDFLNHLLFHKKFKRDDLIREKSVIAEEMKTSLNDDNSKFWNTVLAKKWPNSWKSRQIMGTEDSIAGVGIDDVLDFYSKHYVPNKMVLVCVTSLNPTILMDKIKFHFEK